jgi:hypothetical protein
MFAAWIRWYVRKLRVANRQTKMSKARYVPNVERCEERLPPGQLVGFDFGLFGDPLALNDTSRPRNVSSILPEHRQTSRDGEPVLILSQRSMASKQHEPELDRYTVREGSSYAGMILAYGARWSHMHYLPWLGSQSAASSTSAVGAAANAPDSVTRNA